MRCQWLLISVAMLPTGCWTTGSGPTPASAIFEGTRAIDAATVNNPVRVATRQASEPVLASQSDRQPENSTPESVSEKSLVTQQASKSQPAILPESAGVAALESKPSQTWQQTETTWDNNDPIASRGLDSKPVESMWTQAIASRPLSAPARSTPRYNVQQGKPTLHAKSTDFRFPTHRPAPAAVVADAVTPSVIQLLQFESSEYDSEEPFMPSEQELIGSVDTVATTELPKSTEDAASMAPAEDASGGGHEVAPITPVATSELPKETKPDEPERPQSQIVTGESVGQPSVKAVTPAVTFRGAIRSASGEMVAQLYSSHHGALTVRVGDAIPVMEDDNEKPFVVQTISSGFVLLVCKSSGRTLFAK